MSWSVQLCTLTITDQWSLVTRAGVWANKGRGEELNCALNNSNHWLLTLWSSEHTEGHLSGIDISFRYFELVTHDSLFAQETIVISPYPDFFISTDVCLVKSYITPQPPVVCPILAPIILPARANEAAANIPRNNFSPCPRAGRGEVRQ